MILEKLHRLRKTQGNQGFSLVELIISITILVLVMLPIMNSFYRSAQMNKKAEDIQEQSNIAASIMEGLRNLNIEQTIDQFTGTAPFDIITDENGNPNAAGYTGLLYDSDTGKYSLIDYSSLGKQATYYFAVYGIDAGGTAYDALIAMDSSPFKPDPSVNSILNSYPMPDAINLDIIANGLFFSDGRPAEPQPTGAPTSGAADENALATFIQWGTEYAKQLFYQSPEYLNYQVALADWTNENEKAEMNGATPPPQIPIVDFKTTNYPEYCNPDTIKTYITKTMIISIRQTIQGSTPYDTIDYTIVYNCDWPSGSTIENTIEYPVSSVIYRNTVDNIYLFYDPSDFALSQDYINIDNQIPGKTINFFLAHQNSAGGAALHGITISDSAADGITVYTNLSSGNVTLFQDSFNVSGTINPNIVNTEQKDRIYNTDIKLYKHVESTNIDDKFKTLVYTLSSATENADSE